MIVSYVYGALWYAALLSLTVVAWADSRWHHRQR